MLVPRWFFLYLWIAPHALLVVLAIMMIRRKLVRQFPAFFSYTVFEVVQFVLLFTLDHVASTAQPYFVVWVIGGAGSIGLRFAVWATEDPEQVAKVVHRLWKMGLQA